MSSRGAVQRVSPAGSTTVAAGGGHSPVFGIWSRVVDVRRRARGGKSIGLALSLVGWRLRSPLCRHRLRQGQSRVNLSPSGPTGLIAARMGDVADAGSIVGETVELTAFRDTSSRSRLARHIGARILTPTLHDPDLDGDRRDVYLGGSTEGLAGGGDVPRRPRTQPRG